jgi:hypothetical protein
MSTILRKGVIQGGQVVVAEPIDLPDGSEVTILGGEDNGLPPAADEMAAIDFMTEDEQSDDPEAVEQWVDDLRSIPPVPENPEKEAEWRAWDETMRQFNIEAVRKQFEEGTP